MYINYYGNNVLNSIVLPVYLFEINAKSNNVKNNNLDVLGEAILGLLDVNEVIDITYISNLLGMPSKYKKLIEYEINELCDAGNITIDENKKVLSLNNVAESYLESFYVIYDRVNKIFLDAIIPKNELDKKMYYRDENIKTADNYIIEEKERSYIQGYNICYLIQQLISKSNNSIKFDEEDSEYSQIDEMVRPFYRINLDTVENLDKPIEGYFLYKVSLNKEMEIEYEDPFTRNNYYTYIEKNIINKVDYKKVKSIIKRFDFIDMDFIKDKIQEYLKTYTSFDNDGTRLEHIDKIAYYKAVIDLEGEDYKKVASPINNFDKVAKSILKDIVDKFADSKFEKKNIKVGSFNTLSNINDIRIIESFINENIKKISKDFKVIREIGQTSIVSYLKAIYLSKYFSQAEFDKNVFEIFSTDYKLIKFLNDVWLYRNNTGHNVEKGRHYDSEYDLDIMSQERLREVMDVLTEGLIYFVSIAKKL